MQKQYLSYFYPAGALTETVLSPYESGLHNEPEVPAITLEKCGRNDILKKDAYFEQTVMVQVKEGMDKLGFEGSREDRTFIQSRIVLQYLAQYHATYPAA